VLKGPRAPTVDERKVGWERHDGGTALAWLLGKKITSRRPKTPELSESSLSRKDLGMLVQMELEGAKKEMGLQAHHRSAGCHPERG
jgi:hypothetical protein